MLNAIQSGEGDWAAMAMLFLLLHEQLEGNANEMNDTTNTNPYLRYCTHNFIAG